MREDRASSLKRREAEKFKQIIDDPTTTPAERALAAAQLSSPAPTPVSDDGEDVSEAARALITWSQGDGERYGTGTVRILADVVWSQIHAYTKTHCAARAALFTEWSAACQREYARTHKPSERVQRLLDMAKRDRDLEADL